MTLHESTSSRVSQGLRGSVEVGDAGLVVVPAAVDDADQSPIGSFDSDLRVGGIVESGEFANQHRNTVRGMVNRVVP